MAPFLPSDLPFSLLKKRTACSFLPQVLPFLLPMPWLISRLRPVQLSVLPYPLSPFPSPPFPSPPLTSLSPFPAAQERITCSFLPQVFPFLLPMPWLAAPSTVHQSCPTSSDARSPERSVLAPSSDARSPERSFRSLCS